MSVLLGYSNIRVVYKFDNLGETRGVQGGNMDIKGTAEENIGHELILMDSTLYPKLSLSHPRGK